MDAIVCQASCSRRKRITRDTGRVHIHIPMNPDYITTLLSAYRFNEGTGHGYSTESRLSSGASARYTDCLSKLSNEF